jgi:hypothetical protein
MNVSRAVVLGLIVAPLCWGAAPDGGTDTPKPELHRGIEYRGAGAFLTLPAITVVFPAGPGEPVELNRHSAEARARWLAAAHKSKVAVVADDQVSEEQKTGNLLLLGWNNRVFDTPGLVRPFKHDQEGTSFLGIRENDATLDLLVYHRNPLNWSSYILFWSRMDPERDRFQVLPRLGSDWALYRNFGPVRQGMFVPARVWPPARDTVAEANFTSPDSFRPGGTATFDSPHYRVIFDRARYTDADVRAIADAREAALAKAVAALGPTPDGFRVNLYLYEDKDNKQKATGVLDPTHAVASGREIHAIRGYALAPTAREEIHILARAAYGPCFLTALYEGLAISVENTVRGEDLETLAARLRAAGKLPPLEDLLDEERFRALPGPTEAAAAGALLSWLRQTYGPAGLKKIYSLADGRVAALATALGNTEVAVAASYSAWADGRVSAHRSELDFEAAGAEAQSRWTSSDWAGMIVALRKALKAKPGDPQTLFNLASAQMRDGDLAGAETSIKSILSASLAPGDSRFRIFGHYQLGRVYDLAGRRAEALAEYDAVLALPDEQGAHALALDRKASPATKEQLD